MPEIIIILAPAACYCFYKAIGFGSHPGIEFWLWVLAANALMFRSITILSNDKCDRDDRKLAIDNERENARFQAELWNGIQGERGEGVLDPRELL